MRIGDPNFEPETPPVTAEYLVGYLFEVGPSVSVGGYSSPVSAQELVAWCRLTGIELQPWEARLLLKLSRQYVSQVFKSEKIGCPEPMLEEIGRGGIEAALVAKNMKRAIEEMTKL